MIGIYKITNPKGKIYIGQSIDIERRFKEYKKLQCSQSRKLYYSFKKYGWEQHKFEIIEECPIDILNEREEYHILLYCSNTQGLNIKLASKPSWTGKKRPEHSKLLKEKGSGLSFIRTDYHKNITKNIADEMWKHRKEEISNKISQSKKGKGLKSVICNETKEIYNSLTECSEKTKISIGCICSLLKGTYRYPTIRGLSFSYYEKDLV